MLTTQRHGTEPPPTRQSQLFRDATPLSLCTYDNTPDTRSGDGLGSFLVQSWHLETSFRLGWKCMTETSNVAFIGVFSFNCNFSPSRWLWWGYLLSRLTTLLVFFMCMKIIMPDSGRRHIVCWCSESTVRDWLADFNKWQPGKFYFFMFTFQPVCVSFFRLLSLNTHDGFVSPVHNKPRPRCVHTLPCDFYHQF